MSRVVTAAEVEAVSAEGRRELAVSDEDIVTPLARDRAVALGVSLVVEALGGAAPSGGATAKRSGGSDLPRLVLESRARVMARRALLRRGGDLGRLEDVVSAVMSRLEGAHSHSGSCGCREGR